MQKILPRGEIENFEHSEIPRVKLPQRDEVFKLRAERFKQLATEHGEFLTFLACLVQAQHNALQGYQPPKLAEETIDLAFQHAMPILPISNGPLSDDWIIILKSMLTELSQHQEFASAHQVCLDLSKLTNEQLAGVAKDVLYDQVSADQRQFAPFVMAALQVYWTAQAALLEPKKDIPPITFGTCPVCGSLPVSSVVHIGGAYQGHRFLHCPTCSTGWHLVRVTCSHCESTKGIHYHHIEGQSEAIKAESCDECHTYRKIFYLEKDYACDPVADDIGSLALDMLMAEADYSRASGNPFLWLDPDASHE